MLNYFLVMPLINYVVMKSIIVTITIVTFDASNYSVTSNYSYFLK